MVAAPRQFWLIADDYGLSPGVSSAIRKLAEERRISGTGCMTLFDDWTASAKELMADQPACAIGLHLTLTDFPALSSGKQLPHLKRLIGSLSRGAIPAETIEGELDAQLDRFTDGIGALPAFVDGHQHVHFLRPVRRWLVRRFAATPPEQRPWIRGAPTFAGAPARIAGKIAVAKLLATGFDRRMRESGFLVRGPLSGFYDWRSPGAFAVAMRALLPRVTDGGVIMCHPGEVDQALRDRDVLSDAREEELAFLSGPAFPALRNEAGLTLAGAEL